MNGKKKIGAYITLDGEKEFRSANSRKRKHSGYIKKKIEQVQSMPDEMKNLSDIIKKSL
ncbi:hypothetical protein [Mediterraneibacter sp. ICN-202921]|uniref:hypothetical protein n=1 Tax=Mediterraneibacter sp. ICN-202921 TaxID=3134657 RepID=UPI0030BE8C5A